MKKRQAAYHRMAEGLRSLEMELHGPARGQSAVPQLWHDIAQGVGEGRKVKVTMWLEQDVLRFFRSLGAGHTTRMARVLASFMHARLAGVVKGPEDVDYSERILTPEELVRKAARDKEWERMEAHLDVVLRNNREGRPIK